MQSIVKLELANAHGVHRMEYSNEKTNLFTLMSYKLGRGASTESDVIKMSNENPYLFFIKSMWGRAAHSKYYPLVSVALVAVLLCAAVPPIYGGLSDCEKSGWVVLGTVTAIFCDIVEAVAIQSTFIFTATTARELLCQLILPFMGIAKFAGKVGKVGGQLMTVEAAVGVGGEAVLMYTRFMGVVRSQPTWNVGSGPSSGAMFNGNCLTAEEELLVIGLLLEKEYRR